MRFFDAFYYKSCLLDMQKNREYFNSRSDTEYRNATNSSVYHSFGIARKSSSCLDFWSDGSGVLNLRCDSKCSRNADFKKIYQKIMV